MLAACNRLLPAVRAALPLVVALVLVAGAPALALAQDAAPAAAPAAGGHSGDNIFLHIIKSVGIFWAILLPTSIWLIALVVLLSMDLKMSSAIPDGFVEEFTDTVNKRDFRKAYEMVKTDPSYLGQVMTSGMSRLQYGLPDAREAAMNTLEGLKSDKEQKNNYTAVIATLGPLLGLVGTVFGMIESFMVLASGTSVNAPKLAEGISHALAVTLVGIGISVPAVALNTYFRNRITKIAAEVWNTADDLLTQMYHNSKKPAPPAGAAPPAPAAPTAPARV